MPSFNPFKGSMVVLFDFSEDLKPILKKAGNSQKRKPNNEQPLNTQGTSSETGTEQALVSSINYINKTNHLNISNVDEPSQNFKMHVAFSNYEKKKKEKIHPTFDEIKTYFAQQNFPELEAQKFFNYFSSNGWLVGGKTPMIDWTAAAQNWMLNANKFNPSAKPNRAKHLNTTTDKNFSEPL